MAESLVTSVEVEESDILGITYSEGNCSLLDGNGLQCYGPLLEGQGFLCEREFVMDNYRYGRISLTHKNEEDVRAFFDKTIAQTNFSLLDEQESEEKEDDNQLAMIPSPKKTTLTHGKFRPYTVPFNRIFLAEASPGLHVDDLMNICHAIGMRLSILHDKFIVHADVHAGNMYVNDRMQAFLIDSPKSKQMENGPDFFKESLGDMKDLSKVMGGACRRFISWTYDNKYNNKNNNKDVYEEPFYLLLKKCFLNPIAAKYFLQELNSVILSVQLGQGAGSLSLGIDEEEHHIPVPVPQPESRALVQFSGVKTEPRRVKSVVGQKTKSGILVDQVPGAISGDLDEQGSQSKCGVLSDQGPGTNSVVLIDQCPGTMSGVLADQSLGTISRDFGEKDPRSVSGIIIDQSPQTRSGVLAGQDPGTRSGLPGNQGPGSIHAVLADQVQGIISGVLSDQDPGTRSGLLADEGPGSIREVLADQSPGAISEDLAGQDPGFRSGLLIDEGPGTISGVLANQSQRTRSEFLDVQDSRSMKGSLAKQSPGSGKEVLDGPPSKPVILGQSPRSMLGELGGQVPRPRSPVSDNQELKSIPNPGPNEASAVIEGLPDKGSNNIIDQSTEKTAEAAGPVSLAMGTTDVTQAQGQGKIACKGPSLPDSGVVEDFRKDGPGSSEEGASLNDELMSAFDMERFFR